MKNKEIIITPISASIYIEGNVSDFFIDNPGFNFVVAEEKKNRFDITLKNVAIASVKIDRDFNGLIESKLDCIGTNILECQKMGKALNVKKNAKKTIYADKK